MLTDNGLSVETGTVMTPSMLAWSSEFLAQELRDVGRAGSLQKTGTILAWGGGLLSAMGVTFLLGAKDFGSACCEKKYKTVGYLFLGAGAAMVVGGYFMIKKGKKIEGGLALHLDPARQVASLGYRLAF